MPRKDALSISSPGSIEPGKNATREISRQRYIWMIYALGGPRCDHPCPVDNGVTSFTLENRAINLVEVTYTVDVNALNPILNLTKAVEVGCLDEVPLGGVVTYTLTITTVGQGAVQATVGGRRHLSALVRRAISPVRW